MNLQDNFDRTLSVKKVAEILGVNYITALNYIKERKLIGTRVGGQWKIKESELTRFVNEGNHPESEFYQQS